MYFNLSNKFNQLEELFDVIDAQTFDIKWVNEDQMKRFNVDFLGKKCYNAYYGKTEPCQDCPIRKIRDSIEDFIKESKQIRGKAIINGVDIEVKKTLISIDSKVYIVDSIIDSEKISEVSEALVNTNFNSQVAEYLLSINVSGKLEDEIKKLLERLKEIYGATKAKFFKNTPDSSVSIEVKEDYAKDFRIDDALRKYIMIDPHNFSKMLTEENYIFVSKDMIEDERLIKLFDKYNIKNFVYMEWDINDDKYRLLLMNIDYNENIKTVFKSVYNLVTFLLTNSNYYQILKKTSNTDSLTGLLNRNKYNRDIEKLSKDVIDNIGVIYLDLDNLKEVNDKLGHTMGDKLIKAMAKVLKETFTNARIYRIGGDEFVVIAKDVTYEDFVSRIEEVTSRCTRGRIFVSYGVSYQNTNGVIDDMIHVAEKEMYIYKRRHHDKFDITSQRESFYKQVSKQNYMENFYSVLQPKINPYTGNVVGAEALIRCKASTGWRYPNEFIPVFENNDCIDIIDYFMIENVCKLQRRILDTYGKSIPISINISRSTLVLNSFAQDVIKIIEKYNVPLELIRLEITERMDVSSDEIINHGLILKKYGFNIEVDDFGSHFTNLGFLGKNVFSVVKLDRSIVRKLGEDDITRKFIEFVIKECHERNIEVLAEGVETIEDIENIKKLCIDEVQGYYYDKPLDVNVFIDKYIK